MQKIFVHFGNADKEILTKQIQLLKERYNAKAVLIEENQSDQIWKVGRGNIFEEYTEPCGRILDTVIHYCYRHNISLKDVMLITERQLPTT